jgi:hypothetical protein
MLPRSLIVVLALLALAVLAVLAALLRDPAAARRRVEALFRHPAKPAQPLAADHYSHPYWS